MTALRRWNGWGDASVHEPLKPEALAFLAAQVGAPAPQADATLESVLARVEAQPSRLPPHPLVDTGAETRLRASFGQSMHDWLRLRFGVPGRVTDGVAFPAHAGEVRALLDWARVNGVQVLPSGGATSVAGHLTPAGEKPVLTLNLGRMMRLIDLDPIAQLARFEAGVAGPDLEAQLRAHGFTLGHFPQSFELSTLGGWIVTRSSGQQSARYGRIEQLFAGGTLHTPAGEWVLPAFPASAAGPDLREWVLGSEGRLGVVTEATVRVTRAPAAEEFVGVFFPDWLQAVAAVRALTQARLGLSMLRLASPTETTTTLAMAGHANAIGWLERGLRWRGAGEGKCLLFAGFTGRSAAQVRALRSAAAALWRPHGGVSTGTLLGAKWAARRFSGVYLRNSLWDAGYAVDTMETACDWPRVDAMVRAIEDAGRAGPGEPRRAHALLHASLACLSAGLERLFDLRLPHRARLRDCARALASAEVGRRRRHRHPGRHDHAPARRRQGSRALAAGGEGRDRHGRPRGDGAPVRSPRRHGARKPARGYGVSAPGRSEAAHMTSAVLPGAVDLLVVGGGITGAGIALEAARRGVDVMLVEARDFAWGSSSRSSKLVHGGLRYLREGAFGLTLESVRERGRLLHDAPGLVDPQRFLMGHYAGGRPGRGAMAVGLAIYDGMAGEHTRAHHLPSEALALAPHLAIEGLLGATSYLDARTDDARLVMRVLQEARRLGARVFNGSAVKALLRAGDPGAPPLRRAADAGIAARARQPGAIVGARIEGEVLNGVVRTRCVINATGAWADNLRAGLGEAPILRPLRGSHLLFPLWRLPVGHSVSLMHPRDGRPVFATPWEGAALVGTTDLDHDEDPDVEPAITREEVAYLMEAVHHAFPRLRLSAADAICSFAGVRPVVAPGGPDAVDPSKAPREHVVRDDHGLITVTGGKLTTFRVNALDALRHAAPYLPALSDPACAGGRRVDGACASPQDFAYEPGAPIFEAVPASTDAHGPLACLPHALRARLLGRHGPAAAELVDEAAPADLETIAGTATPWVELHWALRHEQVRHLDDLLLRRTRLALLLPDGARALLPRLEPIAREALGWSAGEWRDECERHAGIISRCHSIPAP
jgi:alkyldihydroxyacetonephosphate synthase